MIYFYGGILLKIILNYLPLFNLYFVKVIKNYEKLYDVPFYQPTKYKQNKGLKNE